MNKTKALLSRREWLERMSVALVAASLRLIFLVEIIERATEAPGRMRP